MDIWRTIPETDSLYEVSYTGHIQRIYYRKNGSISSKKYLHPSKNCGSLRVCIIRNGRCQVFSLHRLIAEAFIPNFNIKDPKNKVKHLDGDIYNNNVSNLKVVVK